MALFHCDFFSETLKMSMSMTAIIPQKADISKGKLPVLYLLHGLSDDHTIWQRRTSVERYADAYRLAVIMPNAHRSFYTDIAATGQNYFTYITEEIPLLAARFFNISQKREDSFIAGLSMGGYGAFKAALTYPERYAAAASLSGALDAAGRTGNTGIDDLDLIFGATNPRGTKDDLFHLAGELVKSERPAPALFQCCGTEDFLYDENIRFRDFARKIGLDLLYEEGPGTHEWEFWDAWIKRVLEWLPLEKNE